MVTILVPLSPGYDLEQQQVVELLFGNFVVVGNLAYHFAIIIPGSKQRFQPEPSPESLEI